MDAADAIRQQLRQHGEARAAARAAAQRESQAIRQLVPKALDAGIRKTEVAELAGISRPALDSML